MPNVEVNPDSTVLRQLDNHWQKIAAIIVWKLAGRERITISTADIEKFSAETERGEAVLLSHGHKDSIDFQIVDVAAAEKLAAHDAQQTGRA